MKHIKKIFLIALIGISSSCNKYLDIVPDNVATIESAFSIRSSAEKFLFSCYSYIPTINPGVSYSTSLIFGRAEWLGGDEMWTFPGLASPSIDIAKGLQNVSDPDINPWDGYNQGLPLHHGIHKCNDLIANIAKVPDMDDSEKDRWIAEAKFLKSFYYFTLFRMYGPLVIMDKNLPIASSEEEVKFPRVSIDKCVTYMVGLLDEVIQSEALPDKINNEASELGRITKPIAMALKARILVTAASPFFNGNPDYLNFRNPDGEQLFNSVYDPLKWDKAATACKEAIDLCNSLGYKLYYSAEQASATLHDETIVQLGIRGSVTEPWNSEVIWGNSNSRADNLQRVSQAYLQSSPASMSGINGGYFAPTMKMAELFYSKNGIPIEEDENYDYAGRRELRKSTILDKYNIKPNVNTAALNFDREPRFYASLGFDQGAWYGQGQYNDTAPYYIQGKVGQTAGRKLVQNYSITGYYPKKLVYYKNVIDVNTAYQIEERYPWPEFRLSDLYLLYAEALNESRPADADIQLYLNKIRARAGVGTIADSWNTYAKPAFKTKYMSQTGMRDIIRQERGIELAFEGSRFWDLRRWKTAEIEYNKPIRGWSVGQLDEKAYYQEVTLFNQTFQKRDYLWPLREATLIINNKLVQNPGW